METTEPTVTPPTSDPPLPDIPRISFPLPVALDPHVTPAALRTYAVLRAYVLGKLPNAAVPGNDLIEHPDKAELDAFRAVMAARTYTEDQFVEISIRALIDQALIDEGFRLYVFLRFVASRLSKSTAGVCKKDDLRRGLRLMPGELQRLLGLCKRAGYVKFQELSGGFVGFAAHEEPELLANTTPTATGAEKVDIAPKTE